MTVLRRDVIDCYRFILEREPENEHAIHVHMNHKDLLECYRVFYESKEYKKLHPYMISFSRASSLGGIETIGLWENPAVCLNCMPKESVLEVYYKAVREGKNLVMMVDKNNKFSGKVLRREGISVDGSISYLDILNHIEVSSDDGWRDEIWSIWDAWCNHFPNSICAPILRNGKILGYLQNIHNGVPFSSMNVHMDEDKELFGLVDKYGFSLERIVIYNAGRNLQGVLKCCQTKGAKVEYIICDALDDDKSEKQFNYYTLDTAPNLGEKKIIIVCHQEDYVDISMRLKRKGLKEFRDFIFWNFINKKVVFVNAYCHGRWVRYRLGKSLQFNENYCLYPYYPTRHVPNCMPLDDDLVNNIDVYIYIHIPDANYFGDTYSDSNIIPRLKKDCVIIRLPSVAMLGSAFYQTEVMRLKKYGDIDFMYEQPLLEKAYNSFYIKDVKHIIEYVNKNHDSADIVKKLFESTIKKCRIEEEKWDIKIVDWVLENYKTLPIMSDHSHPSRYLMLYICKLVMIKLGLGIDFEEDINDDLFLNIFSDGAPGIMYPYVYEALEMNYSSGEKISQRVGRICCFKSAITGRNEVFAPGIDFREIVQEYFYITKGEMLEYEKKIPFNEETVYYAVRCILGKDLVLHKDVQSMLKTYSSFDEMRKGLLQSAEFRTMLKKMKIIEK